LLLNFNFYFYKNLNSLLFPLVIIFKGVDPTKLAQLTKENSTNKKNQFSILELAKHADLSFFS